MKRTEVGALIPVVNEARNIPPLVERLEAIRTLDWALFVIDESTDGTEHVLAQLRKQHPWIRTYRRHGRRGLGIALQEGMRFAVANYSFDRIVALDADLSHDPRSIPRLLRYDADLVLGSRYVNGAGIAGWTVRRRLLSWGANLLARLLLGVPYRDLTTGFRVYSRWLAKEVAQRAQCGGYEFQVEGVGIAHRLRLSIREVPILFGERAHGLSKLSARYEIRRFVTFLLRSLLHRGRMEGGIGRPEPTLGNTQDFPVPSPIAILPRQPFATFTLPSHSPSFGTHLHISTSVYLAQLR